MNPGGWSATLPLPDYGRVARDPGTILGHKLIAPVVPAGASLA